MNGFRPKLNALKSNHWFRFIILLFLPLLSGCDPTINFYGSFFPAWTWCLGIGLILTFLAHLLFSALRLERNLGSLVIVYPCLMILLTVLAWLLLFQT